MIFTKNKHYHKLNIKMPFKFCVGCNREVDNVNKNVKFVKFEISRWGKHFDILTFEENITEAEAVQKVEEYFNQPVTEKYFNLVKDDLYGDFKNYLSLLRGNLIASKYFLDFIERTGLNMITLIVGS